MCETTCRDVRQKHRGGCAAVKELLCDWCGSDEGHSTLLPFLWHHGGDEWSGQSEVQRFNRGHEEHRCADLNVTLWGAAKESPELLTCRGIYFQISKKHSPAGMPLQMSQCTRILREPLHSGQHACTTKQVAGEPLKYVISRLSLPFFLQLLF